jgi:hypothetical protein
VAYVHDLGNFTRAEHRRETILWKRRLWLLRLLLAPLQQPRVRAGVNIFVNMHYWYKYHIVIVNARGVPSRVRECRRGGLVKIDDQRGEAFIAMECLDGSR